MNFRADFTERSLSLDISTRVPKLNSNWELGYLLHHSLKISTKSLRFLGIIEWCQNNKLLPQYYQTFSDENSKNLYFAKIQECSKKFHSYSFANEINFWLVLKWSFVHLISFETYLWGIFYFLDFPIKNVIQLMITSYASLMSELL